MGMDIACLWMHPNICGHESFYVTNNIHYASLSITYIWKTIAIVVIITRTRKQFVCIFKMMEETQHMKVQTMEHLQCPYTKLNMDKK